MKCKICDGKTDKFAYAKILKKYDITYYQCQYCGFVQTEDPYWLDEAYSDAIIDSDIGLIDRNIYLGNVVSSVIKGCFKDKQNFLDYGAGFGMFVRIMRDRGFNFQWYDKYCENLFAKCFEKTDQCYDVLTAFELFEHFGEPKIELRNMLKYAPNIIFTTLLLPSNNPKPDEWWYYTLDGGQHISFYTAESLNILAKSYNKYYVGVGNLHVFSERKISKLQLYLLIKFATIFNRIKKQKSLLEADYEMITGKKLE